jgi:uncharacterized protein YndB with AHSA1/START domain
MNEQIAATRSIVVERLIPHPPEKIWRALTQAHLIEQWLMKNDFEPRLGAQFTFRATPMGDWNGIVHCEVTAFDPPRRPAYSWKGGSAVNPNYGAALDSVVEWVLAPEPVARASAWSIQASARGTNLPLRRCPAAGRGDWSAWSKSPPLRSLGTSRTGWTNNCQRMMRRTRERNKRKGLPMKIKLTSVYVDDQEKALRFYTETLGFTKKADFSNGPFRWLTVASPDEPGWNGAPARAQQQPGGQGLPASHVPAGPARRHVLQRRC